MFLRHSDILESPGKEQSIMSYFIVITFPVSEGEHVMFRPVLTPGLAAAERNSCLTWDAFCGGCLSRHSLRQLLCCFLHPEQFLGGAGESQQLPQIPHLAWGFPGWQAAPGLCESMGSQGTAGSSQAEPPDMRGWSGAWQQSPGLCVTHG